MCSHAEAVYVCAFVLTRALSIVCFCRVVQVELSALGLQTAFQQLRVADLGDDVWQGVRNKYWKFPLYFLPIVKHAAATAELNVGGEEEPAGGAVTTGV